MIFIPAAIGAIMLLSALSMAKQSFLGKDCYYYGELSMNTFCYNSSIHHTLVGVGLALLALTGFMFFKAQMKEERRLRNSSASSTSPSYQPVAQPVAASILTTPAWTALREFDTDIQAAVAQLKPFDAKAEERLATAYLAVNDKGLLPSIVAKIIADERKAAIVREEEKARRAITMSEREKEQLADRVMRSEHTIDFIKESNMVYDGRKVISAEMYYGKTVADQGWAKIVYADGKVELRSGSTWTLL